MPCIEDIWAGGSNAKITPPTATDISNGFVCGPADEGIFNWLFNKLTSCFIALENSVNTTIANLASVQAQVSQNISDIEELQSKTTISGGMNQGTIV